MSSFLLVSTVNNKKIGIFWVVSRRSRGLTIVNAELIMYFCIFPFFFFF